MFRGLFNKRRAEKNAKSTEPVPSPAPAPAQPSNPASPVPLDDAMLAISRELSGLAEVPVAQAARERGWASVQRELERRPVGATPAGARRPRPARARSWRWAIASAAAAVAVIATLVGTYSGGLLQTADSGDQTTTVTTVVSSDTTEPATTISTEGTTVSSDIPGTTEGPTTTEAQPSTTQFTETTVEVQPSTTATTAGSGSGTGGGVSPTTQPSTPTTTSEQQYASTQREGSARAVAAYLADLVITGNTSGARALVGPEAQASLAQMMMSLSDPYGYKITGVQSLSDNVVRVSMQINDRVVNLDGELVEALPKFAIRVRVDDKGAVITAINAG